MQGYAINCAASYFTTEAMNVRGVQTIYQDEHRFVAPSKPLLLQAAVDTAGSRVEIPIEGWEGAGDTNYALQP